MDISEFQLRYQAFIGLSKQCKLHRDDKTLLEMTHISDKGIPDKAIQEISPDELKELTKATYTKFKREYIETQRSFSDKFPPSYRYPLAEYIERLEYELKVIKEMGFHTYMLVVSDFVMWAKKNNIMVGPGRGSGAGSLLARLVGITDINPFHYDLLFERFLNPARISMPDFDIDFEDTLRDKVVDYVTERYGADKVCAIGTYMKLSTKAAFKDVARTMGIPFDRSNLVSTLLPEHISLKEISVDNPAISDDLRQIIESDKVVANAIMQGAGIEGNLRQLGVHACGIIISPDPINAHTPTQIIFKAKIATLVSQYEGPTLEYIGLLKMDFLGLRNLSVIKNCIKIINAKYRHLDHENELSSSLGYKNYLSDKILFDNFLESMSFDPPMDNHEVFDRVFAEGDTTGIFQFEGEGIRKFLVDLKPNSINDLVAMNALYRPGPMEFIPSYIKRKSGDEAVEYMLPELVQTLQKEYGADVVISEREKLINDLGPIMDLTYGIAVYQEQLMFLVQSMAGFSLPEADLLRRGVGKKKKDVIEKIKKEFVTRAASYKDYKSETATFIYEKMIEPAASYSFNKSHAVCYAHIAYQTGYLKARYPVEFYAALLRSVEEDTDKLSLFIDEIHAHHIRIDHPDINRSFNHVAAIENSIILGFYCCKGIGLDIGEQIEGERKNNGSFVSLEDFLSRCHNIINKRMLESLIKAGCFDQRHERKTLLFNIDILLERHKKNKSMETGLFGNIEGGSSLALVSGAVQSIKDICEYEMEIFKNMISGHPLDGLYLYAKKYGFIDQYLKQPLSMNDEGRIQSIPFTILSMVKRITRAKKKGFFITVEDITGSIEFFLKDPIDLKIYDILQISGSKGRNRSVETMIKISLDTLINQAKKSGKYDPTRTVITVRNARGTKGIIDSEREKTSQEGDKKDNSTSTEESDPSLSSDTNQEYLTPQIVRILIPSDISRLKVMRSLIQGYPGDEIVAMGEKTLSLSSQGIEELRKEGFVE